MSVAHRSCSHQSQRCRASVLPCPLGLQAGEHWSYSCRRETKGFREQQPPLVSRMIETSSAVLALPWEFPQAALAMAQVAEDDHLEQQTHFPREMHQLSGC